MRRLHALALVGAIAAVGLAAARRPAQTPPRMVVYKTPT